MKQGNFNGCLPSTGKTVATEAANPNRTISLLQNPFWEVGSEDSQQQATNFLLELHIFWFDELILAWSLKNTQARTRYTRPIDIISMGYIHSFIYRQRNKMREPEEWKLGMIGYGARMWGREDSFHSSSTSLCRLWKEGDLMNRRRI